MRRCKDVVTRIGNGITPSGGSEVYLDQGIPFLRSQNIHDDGLQLKNVSYIQELLHQKMKNSQLCPNDILINITGASIGRTCLVPDSLINANINQHIAYLRLKNGINHEFVSYYLKANKTKQHIQAEQTGASKEALRLAQIATIPISLPPLDEQKRIADYLDRETDLIDRKVALLEEKEKLYKELKQALINETVTRGLDKSASLRPSGIDWIGDIPEHWVVKRAKDLFKKQNRRVKLNDSIVTAFRDGQVTLRSKRRTNGFTHASKEIGYQGVRRGDLIIHAMDGFAGAIGVSDSDGKSSPVYSVYTPYNLDDIYMPFYGYLCREMALTGFIESIAKGIRERSTEFRHKEFAASFLIVPPISEQISIATYLEEKTTKIDQIVEAIQKQILLLKELRKTLINDIVTGKLRITETE